MSTASTSAPLAGAPTAPAQAPVVPAGNDLPRSVLRAITVAALVAAVAFFVRYTLTWRLAIDSPVMHYVVFLMRHGLHPYRDIGDNNMPGAYMSEALAMRIFGDSDLSWRIYEFSLLGLLCAAMVTIARRWDWVAGVFAAGVFIILHGADGPQVAAERELVIAVLLLVAYALLFSAIRSGRPWLMLGFGLACGAACSIKPTYLLLPVAMLALTFAVVRRRGRSPWPYLLWGAAGLVTSGLVVLAFLVAYSALPAFLLTLRMVLPAYSTTGRVSPGSMLLRSLPHAVLGLLLVSLVLVVLSRGRGWDWERWALAAGAAAGLLSFLLQGKGFVYHRYPTMAFALLLIGLELFDALRLPGWPRALGAAALAAVLLLLVPGHVRAIEAIPPHGELELAMEQDLRSLAPSRDLQGQVECLDMVYGCLNALYHLDLVQNNGYTGDMVLFVEQETPLVRLAREGFMKQQQVNPAGVLVISNQLFSEANSFAKVERWPAFATSLDRNYALVIERTFPHERFGVPFPHPFPASIADGYRLYVKRDSPLLARARTLTPEQEIAVR